MRRQSNVSKWRGGRVGSGRIRELTQSHDFAPLKSKEFCRSERGDSCGRKEMSFIEKRVL